MSVSRGRKLSRRVREKMAHARKVGREKAAPPVGLVGGLMRHQGIKGDPRDWVCFLGAKFIDGDCDDTVTLPEAPVPEVAEKTVLVHKRRLAEWIGEPLAAFFWQPGKLGGRVPRRVRQERMAAAAATAQETDDDEGTSHE